MKSLLEDLKVLDVSRVLAGPYTSMMLGDLGAEVIKVERPGIGDQTRHWGPPNIKDQSAYYLSINRNKRSITLDLKSKEGKEIFLKLVRDSDVVVEDFRPGGMKKFGLGYSKLKEVNPKLIYCSITGYGETGPWKDRPAYDIILQGEVGFMSITGEEGRPPVRIGVAIIDIITALYAVQGILTALIVREREGVGQKVDVSMMDCGLSSLTYMANYYFATGESPKRMGPKHPTIAPYQAFETKDNYIIVAVASQAIWSRFCKAIGRENLLQDPRFKDNPRRVKNREKLEDILGPIFKEKATEEWVRIMGKYDVPATPVNDMERVFTMPQIEARDMLKVIKHPTIGQLKTIGIPVKFERTSGDIRRHPPLLGEHTEEILKELGYSEESIQILADKGVI